jgi:hypothetical protein
MPVKAFGVGICSLVLVLSAIGGPKRYKVQKGLMMKVLDFVSFSTEKEKKGTNKRVATLRVTFHKTRVTFLSLCCSLCILSLAFDGHKFDVLI